MDGPLGDGRPEMGLAGAGCGFSESRRSFLSDLNSRHLFVFAFLVGLGSTAALVLASRSAAADTWRGLAVAPEFRCSPYISRDYSYPQSVEAEIVAELGGIYSPYTLEHFANTRETDIEHIVARSEAHDSGLCATDPGTRRRFASDLLNLTLAEPSLNRHDKRDHDAAGWLPPMNRCWFANRVVEVRRKYDLTIDRHEADVLERLLSTCTSTELVFRTVGTTEPSSATSTDSPKDSSFDDRTTAGRPSRAGRKTRSQVEGGGMAEHGILAGDCNNGNQLHQSRATLQY